ncbi:MAG: bifunctional UDP-N-acetylglucosamine diphosphorylase/glucosamine-1-phosphate N-acetyltransferase GlmU [Rhodobacteraceae bacterium]|nr:bifunctional UDP-N-acetylglucosamine diphosphorylase/glucosamine-1-phosphate N-acetyltransferase GlmU [Paracoccaceae bacterium]
MPIALVIPAAGQGTRMLSTHAKVLHRIGGAPLIAHTLKAGAAMAPERTVVVTGHRAEAVEAAVGAYAPEAICIRQQEPLGTGHAVLRAAPALKGFEGDILVLYGDTPFITLDTLQRMVAARARHDIVVTGFEAANPEHYGRLIMDGTKLVRIVEAKDASDADSAVRFCNSGLMAANANTLMRLLHCVGNSNAAAEYQLTDILGLATAEGLSATAITCPETEALGINTRAELAGAEALFQTNRRASFLATGVTMTAPETVHLAFDTEIARDVEVEPYVVFGTGVTVETGAKIRSFSYLEGAHVSSGAVVGPYARLRPGTELADGVRIGNFVEVKSAQIGEGAKVNHLSYIGDASIGEAANIGAGTITCNYDGVMKHQTEIGAAAFIGSNTMLVAPVRVGSQAMTASGSVITQDVPDQALAVARGKQVNKPGLAVRLMARLKAIKNNTKGQ